MVRKLTWICRPAKSLIEAERIENILEPECFKIYLQSCCHNSTGRNSQLKIKRWKVEQKSSNITEIQGKTQFYGFSFAS